MPATDAPALFRAVPLDAPPSFALAALLVLAIALSERALTHALATHWCPLRPARRSPARRALWRTALFWLVTLDRLLYMLVAMTLNAGLIAIAVSALAAGQFAIELRAERRHAPPLSLSPDAEAHKTPLLRSPRRTTANISSSSAGPAHAYASLPTTDQPSPPYSPSPSPRASSHACPRPSPRTSACYPTPRSHPQSRTRGHRRAPRPASIYIHPAASNLARADAAAALLDLGFAAGLASPGPAPPDEHAHTLSDIRATSEIHTHVHAPSAHTPPAPSVAPANAATHGLSPAHAPALPSYTPSSSHAHAADADAWAPGAGRQRARTLLGGSAAAW